MGEDSFADLPPEIITDILSRLSVQTIALSKCVCKAWLDLLETDDFVNSCRSKSAAKSLEFGNIPNSLIIKELDMGKPDGRIASKNKKVSVRYTGRLMENNEIFDSNIGLPPFRFRLGVGQFLKGWDAGIDGIVYRANEDLQFLHRWGVLVPKAVHHLYLPTLGWSMRCIC